MLRFVSLRPEPALFLALATMAACSSGTQVPTTQPDRISTPVRVPKHPTKNAPPLPTMSGRLGEYLAFALEHSPQTRAAFERWRAARFQISEPGRLPEPTLSFGYYLRSVETRVGPQRYQVGITQSLPWPTKLSAGKEAATERARAAALVVDANLLSVRREVAAAYWTLWLIGEEHRLMSEHDAVLEALAGAVRGRLQTGAASLADLNQVDLNIARHRDHRGRHKEASRKASAKLRAVLGAASDVKILSATGAPASGLPAKSSVELASALQNHPMLEGLARLAASEEHKARALGAERYPRFRLGLNLIGTGEAAMSGVADSGKDALVVSAGVSLPLWFGSYSDAQDAARATSRSHEAAREASLRDAEAMLAEALANLRDAQRRIDLNKSTLVPQAETTFQAVLGGYQSGRSTVAAVILAQQDLIALRLEHAKARAAHAKTWAHLEFIVGMELSRQGEER